MDGRSSLPAPALEFRQEASWASPLVMVCALTPIVGALAVGAAQAALHLADPLMWAAIAHRPQSALLILAAFFICSVLFAWPLARFVATLGHRSRVLADRDNVSVEERNLFGRRSWSEPTAAYLGLAHRVRTTVSGVRHELILVHPDARRCVTLGTAPRLIQPEVDRICGLLQVAEIPTRDAPSFAGIRELVVPPAAHARLGEARA